MTLPAVESTSQARVRVTFPSDHERCVAWHYPGSNGACVIMAGGLAVPKEPATDLFAARFNAEGYGVLAFDYRRLGESDGQPRLALTVGHALRDWQSAIDFAGTLSGVDSRKLAVWGFSASGGHIFPIAARHPTLAAAIAQTPLVDAPAVMPGLVRYSTPRAQMRLMGCAIRDWLGGLAGREPLLVPLVGPPGTVAMLSTPDALDGPRALQAERYPDWQQRVAARTVLRVGGYRPGRYARRVRCPLLVVTCDRDRSAPPGPAVKAATRAARGEHVQLTGGHYAPFTDAHERAVSVQLSFLARHALAGAPSSNGR